MGKEILGLLARIAVGCTDQQVYRLWEVTGGPGGCPSGRGDILSGSTGTRDSLDWGRVDGRKIGIGLGYSLHLQSSRLIDAIVVTVSA